jgi:hypothetical protein
MPPRRERLRRYNSRIASDGSALQPRRLRAVKRDTQLAQKRRHRHAASTVAEHEGIVAAVWPTSSFRLTFVARWCQRGRRYANLRRVFLSRDR